MKSNYSLLGVFFLIITMASCYSYGPIHIPYSNSTKRNLPPPPTKIVGTPLLKKEYMQKTYTEIKQGLPEAEVQLIEDSIKVLFPNNIIFSTADVLPSSEYQEPLNTFSILLKKYSKTNILITGHSDNKGDYQRNIILSRKRANAIKDVIIENGVARYRLESWGLGDKSPIADNNTEEGRAKNRRVEFVILYDDK